MEFDGLVSRLTPYIKPEPGASAASNQIVASTSGASGSNNAATNSANNKGADKSNAIGVIIVNLQQGFLSDDRFALIKVSDGIKTWKCNFNVDVAQDLHAKTGCATNKKLKASWPLPRFLQGVKNAILDQNCCSCTLEIKKGDDASSEAKLHINLGKAGSSVEENVIFSIPLESAEDKDGDSTNGVLDVLLELAKSSERFREEKTSVQKKLEGPQDQTPAQVQVEIQGKERAAKRKVASAINPGQVRRPKQKGIQF